MRSINDLRLYFKLKAKFPIFRLKKSDSEGWILDVFGPKKDEKTGTKREKKRVFNLDQTPAFEPFFRG